MAPTGSSRPRTVPLACQQAVELVTDYLDGALRRRAGRRFAGHLARCPNCAEYFRQFRLTIAGVARIARSQP